MDRYARVKRTIIIVQEIDNFKIIMRDVIRFLRERVEGKKSNKST